MNRRVSRVQFPPERVVIAVLEMIRFGVRVSRGTDVLKIGFRQRRFVRGQRMLHRPAAAEEKDYDERRENG